MADVPKTFPPTKPKKLHDKWKRFVEELITTYNSKTGHFNQSEAYRRVYPRVQNSTTASKAGHRLLQNGQVQAYFVELRDKMLTKIAADVRLTLQEERAFENRKEDVLRKIASIAYTEMTDLATWGPDGIEVRASTDLNRMHSAAVKKIKQRRTVFLDKDGNPVSERTDVEVETHDTLKALELLGQNVKLFGENETLIDKPYAVLIPARREPGKAITIQKEKTT